LAGLPGIGDPRRELIAAGAGTAARGDGEHQPLAERDAGPGQQRVQEGTEGARGYHFRLLAALAEFGPASQVSLGRRAQLDRSDVAAAVSELAGRKLVRRAADQTDHRRNIITITASGQAHLRRLDTLLADVQDTLLAPLSPGERQELTAMLTRVLDYHAGLQAPGPGSRAAEVPGQVTQA
jgi:DNA-binding MarR family transcriptional regulator